ncbi:MAG: 3-dehydroquinate synthase [Gammaproteobacteria bacterium]|jgi:3-dehydroquinate synthase|nr:3-dehydroquinate synthase [Gammaproteobacteria bacterium]
MFITLNVALGARSYPICIGDGLLSRRDLIEPHLRRRDVLVVTNETVGPIYLEPVRALLAGSRVATVVLPDGEQYKTMATVNRVLDALVEARFGRDGVVLALGGGVVGDIAGFAASIYQRGVDFIQVPTTLLAQVDSAVGGKTGVNHPGGKNLLGAFHQPICVLADTDTLRTLPDRELAAGCAEVVKYGLIADAELFGWLEDQAHALLKRDPAALGHVIRRSCELKAEIVGQDEREHGRRALLNLGHTFGHAIEQQAGYGEWLHGEAVAAGSCMAAEFSARLGLVDGPTVDRIKRLFRRLQLPDAPPPADPGRFLAAMGMDKKVIAGQIRLVLLERIGAARITGDYPPHELADYLREQFVR